MKCPHCAARLGLFIRRGNGHRVRHGQCEACHGRVVIKHHTGKALLLILLGVVLSAALWNLAPRVPLALVCSALLYFGSIGLDKQTPDRGS